MLLLLKSDLLLSDLFHGLLFVDLWMFFTRNGGEQTRDGASAGERSHQNVKTSGVYIIIICGMKERRQWDSKGSRTASSPRFFYIKISMPNAIKLSRNELQGYGAVQHRGNVSFLLWAFFAIFANYECVIYIVVL